jgi:MFS family permease
MDHAGAVFGPLVATTLLSLGWPLRSVFWAALVPGVLSVIAVATVREPPVSTPTHDEKADAPKQRLPQSLRNYLAVVLLFSLGNSSDAFLLLRAGSLGVPLSSLPLLWTVFHIAKLVSSYFGGSLSDRIARPNLIVSGWIVYAATYLAFGMANQPWHAWALFTVYGSYYGLTEPAEKALVRDLAPENVRGRAYGFYSFILGISAIPAGVLTGWLWETWSPFVALATGASFAALAALALLAWNMTNRAR